MSLYLCTTRQNFYYGLLVVFLFILYIRQNLNRSTLAYLFKLYCRNCNITLANKNSTFDRSDCLKRFLKGLFFNLVIVTELIDYFDSFVLSIVIGLY